MWSIVSRRRRRAGEVRRILPTMAVPVLVAGLFAIGAGTPARAESNPNPARITGETWWLMEQLRALEPGTRNGGTYVNTPGYHNTRDANLPSDYSVRDAEDKGGPGDKTAALDWTFPSAQGSNPNYSIIARYSSRLMNSSLDPSDPRLDGWREWFGQTNSDRTVEGYDIRKGRPASSNDSHLWHIHLSEDRDKVTSSENKVAMLSVLKGETVEQWRGGSRPSVPASSRVLSVDGGLHVFEYGANGSLDHAWWNKDSSAWGRDSLTSGVSGQPTSLTADGRAHVFARDSSGGLRHAWWVGTGATGWGVDTVGAGTGVVGDPAAVQFEGRTHVFARATGGALRHFWWTDSDGWGNEPLASGFAGNVSAIVFEQRLHVFGRATDGRLRHVWWSGEGANAGWAVESVESASGISGDVTAVEFEGRLHVFAPGTGDVLTHVWWTDEQEWGQDQPIPGLRVTGTPTAAGYDGGLHVFARNNADTMTHVYWRDNAWNNDTVATGIHGDPVASVHDGTLHVFARSKNNTEAHVWWTPTGWATDDLAGNLHP